ncbi:MAG: hypothetical protein ACRDRV_05365, partial [Pseudonocardiaceae bacterium]
MDSVRQWPYRWAVAFAPLGVVLSAVLVSCGSGESGNSGSAPNSAPQFAVVTGEDTIAAVGADWFEPVAGLSPGPSSYIGALSVGVDETSAAVLGTDRIALVRPHQPPVTANCADCSGIAVAGNRILTTRKNFSPGEGFDIVEFSSELAPGRTVSAQRLAERANTAYPAENTDSPVTLAADSDSITVGYLSRNGGNRRGPSILAQYGDDGRLLRNVTVDGIVGRSVVSPDGRQLALEVTGSGGACVTESRPVVVDLTSLRVRPLQPEVPAGVTAKDPLTEPWFTMTDMVWDGHELIATGEVNTPTPEEYTCDADPAVWQRRFDPGTGRVVDSGGTIPQATRWVGPGCGDVVSVKGRYVDGVLARGID